MNGKKKAIIIGDNEKAQYHPLKGPDRILAGMLEDFEVEITEDYRRFREESLIKYDLCLPFADCWESRLDDGQTAGILSFVCRGGGLLSIHNGISVQNRHELAHLHGGKFTMHPEQKVLEYIPSGSGHIILEGIGRFSAKEEPYRFEFDNMAEITTLLEYESDGKYWPAGWALQYGLGRVVYLSPGHNIETFKNPMYAKLMRRSALWAAGAL